MARSVCPRPSTCSMLLDRAISWLAATSPPQLTFLAGVLLASAAFYHGVEFAFELFRPPYIHPSTPVHLSRAWTLTLVLSAYLCRRTPALGQRLDAQTG